MVYAPYDQDELAKLRDHASETGREHERERLGITMSSMWHALTFVQKDADENGFGHYWARMLSTQTQDAVLFAEQAAGMAGVRDLEAAMFNAAGPLENVDEYNEAENPEAAEGASRAAATCVGFATRAAFELYRYPLRPADSVLSTLRRLIELREG